MQKILLLLDGEAHDITTIRFAGFFAKETSSQLMVVIPQKADVSHYERTETLVVNQRYRENNWLTIVSTETMSESEPATVQDARQLQNILNTECEGIKTETKKLKDISEVIKATRNADLLIVSHQFVKSVTGIDRSHVNAKILERTECPVLAAPKEFSGIRTVVFLYGGSRTSAFAMKQFLLRFPHMQTRKAKILFYPGKQNITFPEMREVSDLLQGYFSEVEFLSFDGMNFPDAISRYVKGKQDLFVMGPYGRGVLASIIQNAGSNGDFRGGAPVFISHY